jgi:hypothetical protein
MEAASRTLTPVVLELGGKDAFIVCDDADVTEANPLSSSCLICIQLEQNLLLFLAAL